MACISVNAQTIEWRKDGAKVEDGATLEYNIGVEEMVPGMFYRYAGVTGGGEKDLAIYNLTGADLAVTVRCVSAEATGSGLSCCFGGQCMPFQGNSWNKDYTLTTDGTQMNHRLQLDYYSSPGGSPEELEKLEDRAVKVTASAGGESHEITVKFVNATNGIANISGSNGMVDVYDMAGNRIMAGVSAKQAYGLQGGMYIIRDCTTKVGRKVVVR